MSFLTQTVNKPV